LVQLILWQFFGFGFACWGSFWLSFFSFSSGQD
jgi:hypothetical protein